jgi:hypothetical protein
VNIKEIQTQIDEKKNTFKELFKVEEEQEEIDRIEKEEIKSFGEDGEEKKSNDTELNSDFDSIIDVDEANKIKK